MRLSLRGLLLVTDLDADAMTRLVEGGPCQPRDGAGCPKLANDGLTVAGRLQRELDAVRAENKTLHYLHNGGR